MELVVALVFLAKLLLSLVVVFFGVQGFRRDTNFVGDVADRVRVDPALRRKANHAIVIGGVCAAVLCLPPILWSFDAALSGGSFSLVQLALLVAYTFVVSSALLYPLERNKKTDTTVGPH